MNAYIATPESKLPPDLDIPESECTVQVRVIDTYVTLNREEGH
jgi:hypothetical protein